MPEGDGRDKGGDEVEIRADRSQWRLSAYMFFANEQQNNVREENPGISFSKLIRTENGFHRFWRKLTFELSPGNFITHYIANQVINRQPGGADEILEILHGVKLGMRAFLPQISPVSVFGKDIHYIVLAQTSGECDDAQRYRPNLFTQREVSSTCGAV